MTTKIKLLLSAILLLLAIAGCKDDENQDQAPVLPPYESMVIDFGELANETKSASIVNSEVTHVNWTYSAVSVGLWNVIIGTTFAVPVAAFKNAINHTPQRIDDSSWQWTYTVDGFTSQYTARLVGILQSGQVKWEMYVTKTGINAFDEFMWFEGTSQLDGMSGQWILYHSPTFPEEVVQIDWEKSGEEIGQVKYTYVRELNDNREPANFKNSYLIYGLQDETFDAFVTIHAFNEQSASFADSQIEWSRSDYSGRVMAEHFFSDSEWHCWDSSGADTICE